MILSSAVPTFAVDRRHRVSHFNRACENLTGIRASDIIGTRRQWQPFYAHERPVMADLIIDRVPREKFDEYYKGKYRPSRVISGAYEAEDFFPDLGEEGKWLFFTAAPLRSPDGQIEGAIVTLQDITREKQAAAQNQAMLRISLALPEHRDTGGSPGLHQQRGPDASEHRRRPGHPPRRTHERILFWRIFLRRRRYPETGQGASLRF